MIFRLVRITGVILIMVFAGCKGKPTDIYAPDNYELIKKDKAENFEIYALKGNPNRKMQKFYWNNGSLQAVCFFNNKKKDGRWLNFFEDGKLSAEAFFLEGAEEGTHKTYFLNGQVATIERYTNGKKTGTWEYFDTSGRLVKTRKFE